MENNIVAVCYDTTASCTGRLKGATVRMQKYLDTSSEAEFQTLGVDVDGRTST